MVSVENKILEVPESKIISLLWRRTEVVLPLTEILGEVSDQVEEPGLGSGANLRVPVVGQTQTPTHGDLISTVEFRLVNSADCQFGASNRIGGYEQAE